MSFRKNSQIKLQIAEQFISRFQLSEEETNALRAANITDKFFEALSRVHRVETATLDTYLLND